MPAGAGTTHKGWGRCSHHGGNTPTGNVNAARKQAVALGAELQMEPHDALLLMVRRAAMFEAFCALKVSELADDELVILHRREREWSGGGDNGEGGGGFEVVTETSAELNLWLRAHQQAIRDVTSIAKTACDAGVDERRVRVVEHLGNQLADLLGAVLERLELSSDQRSKAPLIVREQLQLLEGGATA